MKSTTFQLQFSKYYDNYAKLDILAPKYDDGIDTKGMDKKICIR